MSRVFLYSSGQRVKDEILAEKLRQDQTGIFESLRTYGKCLFREEEHLERLLASAKTLGFPEKLEMAELQKELRAALKTFWTEQGKRKPDPDLFVRLTVFQNQIFVMVGERKHSQELYRKGVYLKTSPVPSSLSHAAAPEIKAHAYQNQVMATLQPDKNVYEWVFLDASGFVTGVRIGNLFKVKKGILYTPPETGILNGITRSFVLECAFLGGIPVREIPLTRHEVFTADEAFLTNTSWEVLPVRTLDGRTIGKQVPGPMTRKIHNIFKKKVREECRK